MDFKERLAQTQAKMEEMKARINDSVESSKEAHQLKRDEILVKLAKMDAAVEDFNRDVQAQVVCDVTAMKEEAKADADAINEKLDEIDSKIEARDEAKASKFEAAIDKFETKVAEGFDNIDSAFVAAQENGRILVERYESKANANRLKAQMNMEETKARIEAGRTAASKAAQEQLIIDLLDYADYCQQMALAYAMDAEAAILEACDEIEDYTAKYGDQE